MRDGAREGPEKQQLRRPEEEPAPPRASVQRRHEQRCSRRGERHRERVAARLRGVAQHPGVQDEDPGDQHTLIRIAEAPEQQERRGHGRHAEHEGGKPERRLRRAPIGRAQDGPPSGAREPRQDAVGDVVVRRVDPERVAPAHALEAERPPFLGEVDARHGRARRAELVVPEAVAEARRGEAGQGEHRGEHETDLPVRRRRRAGERRHQRRGLQAEPAPPGRQERGECGGIAERRPPAPGGRIVLRPQRLPLGEPRGDSSVPGVVAEDEVRHQRHEERHQDAAHRSSARGRRVGPHARAG